MDGVRHQRPFNHQFLVSKASSKATSSTCATPPRTVPPMWGSSLWLGLGQELWLRSCDLPTGWNTKSWSWNQRIAMSSMFFCFPFWGHVVHHATKMGMSRIQNVDHPTKFIDEIRWGLFILDMKLDCQPLSAPGASVLEMMITWRTSTQVATFVGRAGEPTFSWEGYLCHQ